MEKTKFEEVKLGRSYEGVIGFYNGIDSDFIRRELAEDRKTVLARGLTSVDLVVEDHTIGEDGTKTKGMSWPHRKYGENKATIWTLACFGMQYGDYVREKGNVIGEGSCDKECLGPDRSFGRTDLILEEVWGQENVEASWNNYVWHPISVQNGEKVKNLFVYGESRMPRTLRFANEND